MIDGHTAAHKNIAQTGVIDSNDLLNKYYKNISYYYKEITILPFQYSHIKSRSLKFSPPSKPSTKPIQNRYMPSTLHDSYNN